MFLWWCFLCHSLPLAYDHNGLLRSCPRRVPFGDEIKSNYTDHRLDPGSCFSGGVSYATLFHWPTITTAYFAAARVGSLLATKSNPTTLTTALPCPCLPQQDQPARDVT